MPISVGFQSGSHYSTIQALEQYLPRDQIKLTFEDGMLFRRLELLIDGKSRAAALFSGPYYLVEQLGFRKVIDTTFMIAAMINGSPIQRTSAAISVRSRRRSATSISGRSSTPTTTRTNSPSAGTP